MDSLRTTRPELMDVTAPVLKKDMATAEFIGLLKETANEKYPVQEGQTRTCSHEAEFLRLIRAAGLFEGFLMDTKQVKINPTEPLMDDFLQHLISKKDDETDDHLKRSVSCIRVLINDLPADYLQRPLLTGRSLTAASKFNVLTPKSQILIRDYLRDGKKTTQRIGQGHVFNGKPLSPQTRDTAVSSTMTILKHLNLNDLTKLTEKRVNETLKKSTTTETYDTCIHQLNDIKSLYKYLCAMKVIKKDPLANVPGKPFKRNSDFVSKDGIDYILNLNNMKSSWNDFIVVRDRCISLLLYDMCLRIGEASLLRITDFAFVDGFVELTLRPEVQKGQNKEMAWIYNFFPQTLMIVKRYLELRKEQNPTTDDMFLTFKTGQRLATGTCQNVVQKHLDDKDLKSDSGKPISSHEYRHAFCSLNRGSVGLCLSKDELGERLRHVRRDLVSTVYTTNTRMLAFEEHKERVRLIEERQERRGVINRNAKKLPSFHTIANNYATTNDATMPENDALDMLSKFGFTAQALRKVAQDKGMSAERDGVVFYSQAWILDLKTNRITKQDACKKLKMTEKQYWHFTHEQKIETLVIGRASLIRPSDAWKGLHGKSQE